MNGLLLGMRGRDALPAAVDGRGVADAGGRVRARIRRRSCRMHATLGNYRELFAHAGIGRYLANSVLLATCATLLSLLFNVSAGYAFAKLRFAGRERLFKLLLGALVDSRAGRDGAAVPAAEADGPGRTRTAA